MEGVRRGGRMRGGDISSLCSVDGGVCSGVGSANE